VEAKQKGIDEKLQKFYAISICKNPNDFLARMTEAQQNKSE